MAHAWDELEEMGGTFRPGPGLSRGDDEDWADVIVDEIEDNRGPTCVRFLVQNMTPAQAGSVLDFGCGVGSDDGAIHVQTLRMFGFDCIGYEWEPDDDDESERAETYWELVEEGFIDPDALGDSWDTVIANNVLNIQPSWEAMAQTLEELKGSMEPSGVLLANLPSEPRRLQAKGREGLDETEGLLEDHFGKVVELEPGLWACYKPRRS